MEGNRKKIYSKGHILIYEGHVLGEKPYGPGIAYFHNGNKYQEGQFGVKGLLSGKEYYPNGQIRFEGEFRINRAYGPNAPVEGIFYDKAGNLIYHGKFKIHVGGVGYPTVEIPKGYGSIPQPERPKDLEYLTYSALIQYIGTRFSSETLLL